ncbi:MAG: hypothetical protein ABIS44_03045 [Mycobacteriales bacterium]
MSPVHLSYAVVNGRIAFTAHHNGAFTAELLWHVENRATGQRSNTATMTIVANCNTAYECF